MILITGASGNTGMAVLKALKDKGEQVRVFVHRESQIERMRNAGADEVVVGDLLDSENVRHAYEGVRSVYHICSAYNPDEIEIGKIAIQAAEKTKIEHFVYHSVLHSIAIDMEHHRKKHEVEKLLVNSEVPYSIVQPAPYMQNLLLSKQGVLDDGILAQKFFTSDETRMNFIDLNDIGEAVAKILTDKSYIGGTYELCGPENVTLSDVVKAFQIAAGKEVQSVFLSDEKMRSGLEASGKSGYFVECMLSMFRHYNEKGFIGSSKTLEFILGRKPVDLQSVISKSI